MKREVQSWKSRVGKLLFANSLVMVGAIQLVTNFVVLPSLFPSASGGRILKVLGQQRSTVAA